MPELQSRSRRALTTRELPWRVRLARWIGHQPWMGRGQHRLISLLHQPSRETDLTFDVDFFGSTYRGRLAEEIDSMVLVYGVYEAPELRFLSDQVEEARKRNGSVNYFDVGANVGHHALFMSRLADKVVAFEPFPPLQARIREKLKMNGIENVTVMPFGLGDQEQTLRYHPGKGSNPGAGTFLADTVGAGDASIPLQIRVGDEVMAESSFPKIDILKVDVEGFEGPVLRGLAKTIRRDRPVILLELGERTRRLIPTEEEFRSLLYDGARIVNVTGRWNRMAYELKPFRFEQAHEASVAVLPG